MDWTTCTKTAGGVTNIATIQCFEAIFSKLLVLAVSGFGLAAFVMLIIGGFKYLTSAGDPKATDQAKQTITYVIAGLFLLVISWLILKFLSVFTGLDLFIFKIFIAS